MTPGTYTTKARTITVLPLPSPPPTPVIPAATVTLLPPPTGSVSLDGSTIVVRSSGEAQVKLACTGAATCSGKLTLTGKSAPKKGKKAKAKAIGTATFSIPAGAEATIKFTLDKTGRALLSAAHGHLSARLAILELAHGAESTQMKTVLLVQHKAHGRPKK